MAGGSDHVKHTSAHMISALREMFACFGLPQQVVSDNGPAKRLVQTVKQGLRSALRKGVCVSLDQALQAFLLRYRTTPQATTGVSPSALMFGRNLRTQLDLYTYFSLKSERVSERQVQQQQRHDRHCQPRELSLEQLVFGIGELGHDG